MPPASSQEAPTTHAAAMRVVGYGRVSTDGQATSGAGMDAQRVAIRAECARRGWILARIEEDALSGKSMKRPGLHAALEACRAGEVGGVVVAKVDRLSRSIVDFAGVLENARRRGYNVVALDLGLDLSTPQGELVGNVIASVAQWERRIIGQRTKDALAIKRAEGVQLGRRSGVAAVVVSRMRRQRARGKTLAWIAAKLNADGVPTAQGGRQWYPATVRAVLRSQEV